MKVHKYRSTAMLPEELGDEIEVLVEYVIENDGIGAYEYWGQKSYDAGEDYVCIEDVKPIFTNQSDELKVLIEQYFEENIENICEEVEKDISLEY
jgi:hypothetical protein